LLHPKRFHSLDALRGVAALAVVFFHWPNFFHDGLHLHPGYASSQLPWYTVLRPLYDSGHLAVDLFFALSGFIFFWLYAQRIAMRQISAGQFFMLRLSRLYPLHLVTLCAVAVGQWRYSAGHASFFVYPYNDAYHFVLNLLMLPAVGLESGFSFNTPVWSVSVEAVLYALFFLVCRRRLVHPGWLAALSLLGFLLVWRAYPPIGRGVGSFFLGGVLFSIYGWVLKRPARPQIVRGAVLCALALWGLALYFSYQPLPPDAPPWVRSVAWRFPVWVLFPVTILALALAETERTGLGRRLSFLGDISYSSYLLHFPLQLALMLALDTLGLGRSWLESAWSLAAFLSLLMVLSMCSYHWLEMPAQRWLRAGSAARARRNTTVGGP
jgi:peptidoglycan/LPS O-acetylase OafA/YrhL